MKELMDQPVQENARRTLLSKTEELQHSADLLSKLASISEAIVEKFERCERAEPPTEIPLPERNMEHQDLIGLFEDIRDQMQSHMNKLENNLEKVLNLID